MADRVSFPSTHWSLIADAGDPAGEQPHSALETVVTRYYPVLKAYLTETRRLPPDQAEDLLHEFVCHKLLREGLLAAADRRRGKFRTLLLNALDNFLVSHWRHNAAAKRAPLATVPVEDVEETLPGGEIPTERFDVMWARQVIQEALLQMHRECETGGRMDIWGVFTDRILTPISGDTAPLPYEELVTRYQLASPSAAYNLLLTAKRMYARCLASVIAEYAPGPRESAAEVAELHALLEKAGKNSGGFA